MKKKSSEPTVVDLSFSSIPLKDIPKYLPQRHMGRFYEFKVGLRARLEAQPLGSAITLPVPQLPEKEVAAIRAAIAGTLDRYAKHWRQTYNPEKKTFLICRRIEFDAITKQEKHANGKTAASV